MLSSLLPGLSDRLFLKNVYRLIKYSYNVCDEHLQLVFLLTL